MDENNNRELISYDLSKPAQTIQFAEVLGRFIKERQLTTAIQGKQYVNVEGWQFALSQLGILPQLLSLEDLSKEGEIKYKADVQLVRISDDKIIGRGIALCSNKERTKRAFEEYAIASMAQTRAEGKAARMLLSWLMKAAGFETTPAEEMIDTPEADEIGDDSRYFLKNLLEKSTIDEEKKKMFELRIDSLILWPEYNKAKDYLMQNQITGADRVAAGANPSARDINRAINKKLQDENA